MAHRFTSCSLAFKVTLSSLGIHRHLLRLGTTGPSMPMFFVSPITFSEAGSRHCGHWVHHLPTGLTAPARDHWGMVMGHRSQWIHCYSQSQGQNMSTNLDMYRNGGGTNICRPPTPIVDSSGFPTCRLASRRLLGLVKGRPKYWLQHAAAVQRQDTCCFINDSLVDASVNCRAPILGHLGEFPVRASRSGASR